MGSAILHFSRSCYRFLSKHLSWPNYLLEQDQLVYYQLQTSPFSLQLLRSRLPHERLVVLPVDCSPGPSCSKLTTSLVNVSLKFQTLISQICQYFLLKNVRSLCTAKDSHIFLTKNIRVFGYKVVKHLTS